MDLSSPIAPSQQRSEEMLTPRSKVAKMLADIDDAPTPSPPQAQDPDLKDSDEQPTKGLGKSSDEPLPPDAQPTKSSNTMFHEDTGSEADDDLEDIRRPRGRAARRMLAETDSSPLQQLQRHDTDDFEEDLYNATPRKTTERVGSVMQTAAGGQESNGLFVSPSKSNDQDSDNELPSNPFGSKAKLQDLIAEKRAERLAKEAEEMQNRHASSSDLPDELVENSQNARLDADIERIMSDATRPTRKASKRALLEMERETQRMARQQALAHQMRVKKKFTTSDLFAKFGYRHVGADESNAHQQLTEGDTTASSAPNSDGPDEQGKGPVSTPPSSPPTPLDREKALVERGALSKLMPVRQDSLASLAELADDEELPEMSGIMKSSQQAETVVVTAEHGQPEKRGLKLAGHGNEAVPANNSDSDDELDILPSLPAHLRIFDKVMGSNRTGRPADSKAIHALKHLSHFNMREPQPRKKGERATFTPNALEAQLRKRARDQARQLQLERIEELKAKGIDVQTVEEREMEAEAFEDLLEKARQDAVKLRQAERKALKEAGVEGGIQVSEDEDEDEDYVGSGSEKEEMDIEDGEGENDDGLIDEEAQEIDEDEDEDEEPAGDSEDEAELAVRDVEDIDGQPAEDMLPAVHQEAVESVASTPALTARKPRKSRTIADEDDDDFPVQEGEPAPSQELETNVDPFAAFNFGAANQHTALMSPTQAFNATMQTPTQATQEDSFDILRHIPPRSATSLAPTISDLDTQFEESRLNFVAGSQVAESQRISLNWETQPPETPVQAGLIRGGSNLSETPGWEPTQDQGLQSPWSVAPKMTRENTLEEGNDLETQSTVQLRVSESPAPSQHAERRGRLGRRRVQVEDDSEDDVEAPLTSVKPAKRDAFGEMARRQKEALTAAEKADIDKEMRQIMDEQAEESEDEYAGLGGDDFVAPETEQDREMIDSSHVDVDERALAAHFAERERVREEAETSKLYKDLTTGTLRRKMAGNTFDLDDDEDEIAARRRQMRQMEEAKKRRALLKDESIASLAGGKQSKGKEAFLKAIADDDDDGDDDALGFADGEGESATQDDSTQSQSQQPANGPLQETSGNKRKMMDADDGNGQNPPAKQRRTYSSTYKRPTSLLEVQESVSFLLEEPNGAPTAAFTAHEVSSDSDNDDEFGDFDDDDDEIAAEAARQNDGGYAPNPISFEAKAMPPPRLPSTQRRTAPKPTVVDRLSLKRASSSGSESARSRTAWAAGPTTDGFKVPSLLRRATTSTSSLSSDRGVTTPDLSRESSGVKMGGTKKSSLAYQARAEERKAIVEASAKRREENTARIAQLRRNSSALSRGLTGRFE